MRVLLAEDDPMIGEAVQTALRDATYAVDWVRNGPAVLGALDDDVHHVLLLDLGLPGIDGATVLRRLRASGKTLPVLILTARDSLQDRVRGLDGGADDYLVKPFELAELLARLRAISRRRQGHASAVLDNGVISLDTATREASRAGIAVRLTGREFCLLQALMLRPGHVLTRANLEDHLYGWNESIESNAVDVIIHGVRRKLGQDAIRNVRGVGWMVRKA